jgi:Glycine cleavage system protein P (pyridoxal-binding), C-terminal domain
MKLNATSEMIPLTWPEFADIHPFASADQAAGYAEMLADLAAKLRAITGFDAISLQPNSGAQGDMPGSSPFAPITAAGGIDGATCASFHRRRTGRTRHPPRWPG